MRMFRSARTMIWAQLLPPSVGGLRRRGPVTCGFAGSRPAPTRRPRAVSSGCGVARRRARAQACTTARSTDLQFVPVLTSLLPARMPPACFLQRRPSSPFSHAGIHSRSSTALTGCSGPDRSPSERSPDLPSSPSDPRHEVPGFGAVCSLVWLAPGTVARCCSGSPPRQPEPTAGWRDCPRLRSLFAANQWIVETSAVVEPILRGRSPRSLPIESLLVPNAKARPISSRGEKTWSPGKRRGTGWGGGQVVRPRLHPMAITGSRGCSSTSSTRVGSSRRAATSSWTTCSSPAFGARSTSAARTSAGSRRRKARKVSTSGSFSGRDRTMGS